MVERHVVSVENASSSLVRIALGGIVNPRLQIVEIADRVLLIFDGMPVLTPELEDTDWFPAMDHLESAGYEVLRFTHRLDVVRV